MKLVIDSTSLELLLEKKKEYIGNRRILIPDIFGSVSLLFSAWTADFSVPFLESGILNDVFKAAGALWLAYAIIKSIANIRSNYSKEDLFMDIKNLDEIQERHSIIAIKDTFEKFPHRFLVYYDKKWDCLFFPNFDGHDEKEGEYARRLSEMLHVKQQSIKLERKGNEIHHKYSPTSGRAKAYDHALFLASISGLPKEDREQEFQINGTNYRWMSLDEMEKDGNVQAKNMDVLGLVRRLIG